MSGTYRFDPTTTLDLNDIRRRLGMASNEDVVLRAIALMKIAAQEATGGVVTILTTDGRTLPVKLVG